MKSGISLGRNTIEVTIIWIWIVFALTNLATSQKNFYTNGRYGKRQDPQEEASSFWSGSRYERSGNEGGGIITLINDEDEEKKLNSGGSKDVELSPRTDRFFLGSRYGKRSSTYTNKNNINIDELKHFETSLDFLISFGHLRTTDKEKQLKILNEQLRDKDNSINTIPISQDEKNESPIGLMKTYGTSENGFACLYTGVTNLYRCFNRKDYRAEIGLSN